MTKKKKFHGTYVAEAPNFINRCIQKEIDDEKVALKELGVDKWVKPNFLVMYGVTSLKDETGETYYKVGLFKSMGGFTVRGEEDLKEVVKFIKHKSKLKSLVIQSVDLDGKDKLTFRG